MVRERLGSTYAYLPERDCGQSCPGRRSCRRPWCRRGPARRSWQCRWGSGGWCRPRRGCILSETQSASWPEETSLAAWQGPPDDLPALSCSWCPRAPATLRAPGIWPWKSPGAPPAPGTRHPASSSYFPTSHLSTGSSRPAPVTKSNHLSYELHEKKLNIQSWRLQGPCTCQAFSLVIICTQASVEWKNSTP